MKNQTTKRAAVLHSCGQIGTGKTILLERLAKDSPSSIQILAPTGC